MNLLSPASRDDIAVLAEDMNVRVGQLSSNETHSGSLFDFHFRRSKNREWLLALASDHVLFLTSANFRHKQPVHHLASTLVEPAMNSDQPC